MTFSWWVGPLRPAVGSWCVVFWVSIGVVAVRAESDLEPLIEVLVAVEDPQVQLDILTGIQDAVQGQRSMKMPGGWHRAYPILRGSDNREVRQRGMLLAAQFRDQRAVDDLFSVLNDTKEPTAWRRTALATLVQLRAPRIQDRLLTLVTGNGPLCSDAIRAAAAFKDPRLPPMLIKQYKNLGSRERQEAINTLCARRESASSLWGAIESNQIPVNDLSAYAVRQLMALEDPTLNQKLVAAWGNLRFTPQDRRKRLAEYKVSLTNDGIGIPDLEAGKRVFVRTCAGCHQLFGEGGKVGPDLTGTQRKNLDYLLENLIDPNALIGRAYQVTTVVVQGRVITGIVSEESSAVLTMRTPGDTIKIPVDEIEVRKKSPVSMMPEGMLDKLTPQELRDLIAYIGSDGSLEKNDE